MKKFLILVIFCICGTSFAAEASDVPKYAILKTTHNYAPIREGADVNAKRFSHLKKGTLIFSDKENKDFYRVDLGLNKYYWIEKKYIDVEQNNVNKDLAKVEGISLGENNKYYTVKVKTSRSIPYNEIETTDKSLEFIIYDTEIDNENLTLEGENSGDFKVSKDEFDNLKISYQSKFPLTGHEVINENDGLLLKVKKPFTTSQGKVFKNITVVIDPGHGGGDSGACAFNLKEKNLNLQISKELEHELKKQGAKVYLTRNTDVDKDLYERVDFAKEKDADFLLSIHQNSLANRKNVDKKHGVGVYYYNKEAYPLAKELQDELVSKTGFKNDGINLASFALTRAQNPICVLIECGYIIHPKEAKKLSNHRFQKLLAKSISQGIKNYLKNNF